MGRYWVLLLPLLLGSCVIPTAVTVASLVANGTSYVTTGKGIADHGISAVADEDCATWRVLKGEEICRPNESADPDTTVTAVAFASGVDTPADPLATFEPVAEENSRSVSTAMLATNRPPAPFKLNPLPKALDVVPAAGATQPRLPQPTVKATGTDRRYVVLGSFASRANANGVIRRHARYGAVTMVVKVKGRRYHRVVAGPFARVEIADVRRSLKAAGIRKPWTIKGCKDDASPAPTCISVWQAKIVRQPIQELATVPTAVN